MGRKRVTLVRDLVRRSLPVGGPRAPDPRIVGRDT
jgi:hypothetical protein